MSREADPYVRTRGDFVVVGVPTQDRMGRGLWLAFVVAPLVVLAVWGGLALFEPEPSATTLGITSLLAALLAGVPGALGMVLVATASRRARKERVQIDLGERLITLPGETPAVFREPTGVRVRRSGGVPGGWSLLVADADGSDELIRNVPRTRGRALSRAADRLAEIFEVSADVPESARKAPLLVPERSAMWAALCYAPVPIVAEAYALWALATSEKSGIRFVAKQSFVQLAVETFFGVAIVGCIGLPVVAAADALPFGFRFGSLACPLVLLAGLRTGVRVFAGFRSLNRQLWVFPWLAPLTRRWLPPEYAPRPKKKDQTPEANPPKKEGWVSPKSSVQGPSDVRSTKVGGPW